MFSFLRDRREQLTLMAGFEEAAAVASWTLITLIEQNEDFFAEQEREFEQAEKLLNQGLEYSEQGNHRAAFIAFMSFIDRTIERNRDLIFSHQNLIDGVVRIRNIQKITLNPLWEKHQQKLAKV